MRVLIVSCVFPPEPVNSAQTSGQIAEELARQGHEVTVIAPFPNRPAGKLYAGYSRRLFSTERSPAGFIICRCFTFLSPQSTTVSRFIENISFGLTSGWGVLTAQRPDVIYSNTWPIFATGIVSVIARLRNIPMVEIIQDIYPESLILQGRMSANGLLANFIRYLDINIARKCARVIVIGNTFAEVYRNSRAVPQERLHVVYNWVDEKTITPNPERSASLRVELGIPKEAFLVVYGGNIGTASGIETAIESFRFLGDLSSVYLLIAGEGSSLPACRRLVAEMDLRRVIFYSPWPAAQTSEVLGCADILLLPTRGKQSNASVPSKLVTYMLTARSVLALALPQSELAVIVKESGCGWTLAPDNPEMLASKIREAALVSATELDHRGRAGREFALKNLSTQACLPRVVDILFKAAQRRQKGEKKADNPILLRPMLQEDIPLVVSVHLAAFPNFFLSFLGPRFLSLYYSQICASPDGIAFVHLDQFSKVAGFVAGSSNPSGFYSRLLKKHWFGFAFASLGAVVRRPIIISRLFRAVLHPGQNPVGKDVAGLYSIGLMPALRGTGAGERLVRAFLSEVGHRGGGNVFLTTDKENNIAVNKFYLKLGFSLKREYATPEGRVMNEYWINLTSNNKI